MTKTKTARSRMDLTEGPIFSTLIRFTMPILLGTIVTQLYNLADSVIVGRFVGSDALASVSAATPVMSIINMFLIGLSSGSNVVIAQHAGAKNKKLLQNSLETISALTLISAGLITVIGLLLSRPLLSALGTPEKILKDSYMYLVVIFLGVTGNLIYQMGSGALRGMGDSQWPFYFLVFCSILNVVLDLVAVLVFHWSVFGVAIATSLSQLISGLGIIYRINHGGYDVKVGLKRLRLDKKEVRNVLSIGLPAAIQNIGNLLAALLVQKSVNVFGPDFISGNSVVTKLEEMSYIPFTALSMAITTFVGQNIGVLKLDRVNKGINTAIFSSIAVGAVMFLILFFGRFRLPYIFTTNEEVVRYASYGLAVMSFSCLFVGIDRVLVYAMRGAGKSVVPMITAQFGAFSRIPLAYLLGARPFDFRGIFYALFIAAALRCGAIAFYYFCGGWKKAVRQFQKTHDETEAEIQES
ncbi:MAG: MATE family efflux transporter [Lachnospiraceae bacterium]|nr:MATE family efflux transporter [Lachnospiraceae bacterium]